MIYITKRGHTTPTQAAEAVIDKVARCNLRGPAVNWAVMVNPDREVWIGRADSVTTVARIRHIVMTVTRASDPDVLADEIREAWGE